jgi:uncharacterized lipoprotein
MMTMKFKIQNFLPATTAMLLMLTGCGLFGDKEEDKPVYFEAGETDYLKVPKGLNEPRRDQAMLIMGDKVPPGVEVESNSLPPLVQITDESQNPGSGIRYSARGSYLLIEDSLENVYQQLKQALESSGMELLDQNESDVTYDFYYADPPRPKQKKGFFKSMLFWRNNDPVDYSGNYRTRLESEGAKTRIYLLDMEGKSTTEGAADAVLGQVFKKFS